MILPTIVSISENSITAVPKEYKEASLALGANKMETIVKVLIPAARSGILSSIILGMGRAIGETMAVLLITGNMARLPGSILDPVATLTGTIAMEMGYADPTHQQRSSLLESYCLSSSCCSTSFAQFSMRGLEGRQADGQESENYKNAIFYAIIGVMAAITLVALIIIIGYILVNGLTHINLEFLTQEPRKMGKEGGIFSVIIGTLYVTGVGILIATPIGIAAAIYFTEYAKDGKGVSVIRFFTEILAGIPSIIFGLFGFAFFVIYLGMGWSVVSGGLTLAMMVLPTLIRATEESLKTVPMAYREGSLSLGATKWQTIVKVIIPCCKPAF
jgi:phosphate transport system permease protein